MSDPTSFAELLGSTAAQLTAAGIGGILVWHAIPRRRANTRVFAQLAFFGLMTTVLVRSEIAPLSYDGGDPRDAGTLLMTTAKILWWVHLAWAVIGALRLYLVMNGKPREARLLQDVVIGIVYAGMGLSVATFVFGIPVGPLVATSGIVAIILGLALQSTLSDVFSGIALGLGRPYRLGDWIVLGDGTEGRVVETDWRSTHLLTSAHNVVVLPHSSVAKRGLTNVSNPDESHALSLTVRVAPTRTPAAIVTIMRMALSSCDSILRDPPPLVVVTSLDAAAIEIELSFRVASIDRRSAARNEVFDLVYRHAWATGLRLAYPSIAPAAARSPSYDDALPAAQREPIDLIKAMQVFTMLTNDEQEALAETIIVRTYRTGDIVVRQGETSPCLMMVRTGVLARRVGEGDGSPEAIGHLSPGDVFGGPDLVDGTVEPCTLQALSRVVIYEIDRKDLAPLLRGRPEMADDLAAMLAAASPAPSRPGSPWHSSTSPVPSLRKAISLMLHGAPFRRAEAETQTE